MYMKHTGYPGDIACVGLIHICFTAHSPRESSRCDAGVSSRRSALSRLGQAVSRLVSVLHRLSPSFQTMLQSVKDSGHALSITCECRGFRTRWLHTEARSTYPKAQARSVPSIRLSVAVRCCRFKCFYVVRPAGPLAAY